MGHRIKFALRASSEGQGSIDVSLDRPKRIFGTGLL